MDGGKKHACVRRTKLSTFFTGKGCVNAMMEVAVYDTKPFDREYLESAPGAQGVVWKFHDYRLSEETAFAAKGAQAVCIFVSDQADRPCLESLVKLDVKLIAMRCSGYNNLDLGAAHLLGLPVVRVPAYSPHAVAEHTVGLLLTLNRKIHRAYNRVRELNFSLNGLVGFDVHGKTVGIVGTGRIGKTTAQIFRGFGANVLAYDPYPSHDWAQTHGIQYADIDTLFANVDILSLHLPLTPETKHLLNARTIAFTKPGIFILNTSRGKLIDTTALIAALKSGHIGGVALDVYEEEEGIFFQDLSGEVLLDDELSHLLVFPNVLITAHQAFLTKEALSEIARVTTENLIRFASGRPFLEGTIL
jgi:D-lactate dehydrogenase